MTLEREIVQILGSASSSCDSALLTRAQCFARCVTREVLSRGGALIVLAAKEPVNDELSPLVFDWIVLEEVAEQLDATSSDRLAVVIVTAPGSSVRRIPSNRTALLRKLQNSRAVLVEHISDDIYSGESIRAVLRKHAT